MTTTSLAGPTLISLEEAEKVLSPYRDRLNRCIQHGWDIWKSDYAPKHLILGPRARAAIVFDEIVACALKEFPQGLDIRTVRTATTFMLYIGDSITLRFKKIRKNGRCSNILTKQQVLFRAQAQLNFPTMLEGTLVHAGYVLDEFQQEIQRKSVVCQLDNSVLWELPLAAKNAAIVEFTPAAPATPATTAAPRFVAKKELVKEIPKVKTSGEDE